MQLVGLPNTRKIRRCEWARSASAAVRLVRKRIAATAADDYGAIHVYDDKQGRYCCQAFRRFQCVDDRMFTSLKDVRGWWSLWLKKIAQRPEGE